MVVEAKPGKPLPRPRAGMIISVHTKGAYVVHAAIKGKG